MVHDVIATCPVCSGELTIARLHCRSCGTALEGEFGVGRFGRLDREQLSLLDVIQAQEEEVNRLRKAEYDEEQSA